jgi:hypothetical protein
MKPEDHTSSWKSDASLGEKSGTPNPLSLRLLSPMRQGFVRKFRISYRKIKKIIYLWPT